MTVAELLEAAARAGVDVSIDGDRLRIRAPRAAADLARQLLERKAEVLPVLAQRAAQCCGECPPGRAGEPLVVACKLCPRSPTYWRTTRSTPSPQPAPVRPAAAVSAGRPRQEDRRER